MNSFATPLPLSWPRTKMRWCLGLLSPIVLAPVWCLAMQHAAPPWGTAVGCVLLLLLLTSSVTDLHHRKIYNWTTYSAAAWAFALNAWGTWSPDLEILGSIGFVQSLGGCCGCFVVMLFAYSLARGGAGDVKLAAAIGALIGLERGILTIAVSYVFAGGAILLWSIWKRGPGTLLVALGRLLGSMVLPLWISRPTNADKQLLNTPVPLAGFFAIGTFFVMLDFPLFP